MKNLEKFDLQKALDGAELVTRDGRKVTDWHYFKTYIDSHFPIYAMIDGYMHVFTIEGKYLVYDSAESPNDLFIKPKVKECWVNVYVNKDGNIWVGKAWSSQVEAMSKQTSFKEQYIKTIRITDEVEE